MTDASPLVSSDSTFLDPKRSSDTQGSDVRTPHLSDGLKQEYSRD